METLKPVICSLIASRGPSRRVLSPSTAVMNLFGFSVILVSLLILFNQVFYELVFIWFYEYHLTAYTRYRLRWATRASLRYDSPTFTTCHYSNAP